MRLGGKGTPRGAARSVGSVGSVGSVDNTAGQRVGAAFTTPADQERIESFRSRFLSGRRTWWDRVETFMAQVEVHSGAYMFDVREHVLFYSLFAAIVFLVAKSLLSLLTLVLHL